MELACSQINPRNLNYLEAFLCKSKSRDAHYYVMIPQNANAINQEKEIQILTGSNENEMKLSIVQAV